MNIGPPRWDEIPAVALANIYKYLDRRTDLLNASRTCWRWRSVLFQRRFFNNFKFTLYINDERQCNFFLNTLYNLPKELIIVFDFLNVYHINKVRRILYKISRHDSLQGIRFHTNSVGLAPPGGISDQEFGDIEKTFVEPLKTFLSRKRPSTKILDLGAIEALTYYGTDFLKSLNRPQDLEEITFASIKYDPSHYPILAVENVFFEKCTSLQVLSLDYDTLNEDVLQTIQILPLKTFMICVHGLDRNHSGISETAWTEFSSKFKTIKLILTLVYAYEAVEVLQINLLRRNMPITHLRVLFCKFMNLDALEIMSNYYKDTLRSVQWIDSAVDEPKKNVMDLFLRPGADPFVMMAWRCKFMEEIVIHGYVLDPSNLVGVSRLLGRNLKRLDVSMIDIEAITEMMDSFIGEISTQLCQNWSPREMHELHPALGYIPVSDDIRDEYILDLIRSDLSN